MQPQKGAQGRNMTGQASPGRAEKTQPRHEVSLRHSLP